MFKITEEKQFVLGTLKIREIVSYKFMSALPNSYVSVRGVIEIREQTIPVMDLAAAVDCISLTEQETKSSVVIATDCQRKTIGFLVKSIKRIMEFSWHEITKSPKSVDNNTFIIGVCRIDNDLIQIIDLKYVMSTVFLEDSSEQ